MLGLYYWSEKVNFGDILSVDILNSYSVPYEKSNLSNADTISIGSILGWIPETFSGKILGSGLMAPVNKRFLDADIRLVRGRYTRALLGLDKSIPIGDPGLLSDRLIEKTEKKYLLGVLPHISNNGHPVLKYFVEKHSADVLLIGADRQPMEVLEDIASCNYIISSSLHGLICAESLGVPNAWFYLDVIAGGGAFKFHDYSSAIKKDIEAFKLTKNLTLTEAINYTDLANEDLLCEVKDDIGYVFSRLKIE